MCQLQITRGPPLRGSSRLSDAYHPVKLDRRAIVLRIAQRSIQLPEKKTERSPSPVSLLLSDSSPYYETRLGAAYLGDAHDLLGRLPRWSVDLIVTSPPFALTRKKRYGNVDARSYVRWFMPFANHFHRVLKPTGSLVIHIGGAWRPGRPVKSLYQFKLLIALCEKGRFQLAQDIYWFNRAKLPGPAQWVTVKRLRLKDAVDQIWWLVKTPFAKANNANVLRQYSAAMEELLNDPNYYKPEMTRPSGQYISNKFFKRNNGAIQPNLLDYPNTESSSKYITACKRFGLPIHPARYPAAIPEFFIKFLTNQGDLVLDPFAGSNVTGTVAESLGRHWVACEEFEDYVKGSMARFFDEKVLSRKFGLTNEQDTLSLVQVAS